MKISDIIYRDEYILSEIPDDYVFEGITTDPTQASEKDILIIPNSKGYGVISFNGNRPLAVICDKNAILPEIIPRIIVENSRLATANAYCRYEGFTKENMILIGVTGTNGKTTTATIIKNVLSSMGYKVGFIGTGKILIGDTEITPEKYSMTTPDPPLLYSSLKKMQEHGCRAVVMEVSSHSLSLDKVTPIEFDYGIFTNLSPEHIDFHKNVEDYFAAKMKLFEGCKCSIFNIDDEYCKRAYDLCDGKKLSCGILWRGDVWASNIENYGFNGLSYTYYTKLYSFKMQLPLPGAYNIYNSMLAALTCIEIGGKPCEVKKIIGNIPKIDGRYEIINDRISVIIDYAHTAVAFQSILSELHSLKGKKKLTVVFGCGGNRDKSKRPQMARIAEEYADRIIITSDNSRNESTKDIISDIIQGFRCGCYEIKENREDAIRSAILEAKDGDIVAIIGKGPAKYNIDKDGYHHFNERKIIQSSLKERIEGI